MTRALGTRALLLDALGTLVELDPPWVHLAAALGTDPDDRLVSATRAEMSYYRAHSHEGRDAESLAEPARPLRRGALARAGPRGLRRDDDGARSAFEPSTTRHRRWPSFGRWG